MRVGPIGPSRLAVSLVALPCATSLRSKPAQKLPPAPVRIATDSESSGSNRLKEATSSEAVAELTALRAPGRLMVTTAIGPSTSNRVFRSCALRAVRGLRIHIGVPVIGRGRVRLFDDPRARPADQVQERARLVVGARCTRAAERLLPHDRAGRLVVDVEVAGGVDQRVRGGADRIAITREHSAREPVWARPVTQLESLLELAVRVRIDGQDRAEQLLLHQLEVGVARLDHGRPHEPPDRVVTAAAGHDLRGVALLGVVDRGHVLGVGLAVDHRSHEVAEFGDVALGDGLHKVGHFGAHVLPHRLWDVRARRGRALLALVFEGAAHQRGAQSGHVRRLVGDDEVLASGLAYQSRVRSLLVDVLADGLPHVLEHVGGAGEVDARELGMVQHAIRDLRRAAAHHVDHARRQAGLREQLHQEVRREQRLRRRLEHHCVAHEHRRGGQVGADRSEVERAHREDEALERSILETVPRGRVVVRLLAQQLVAEVGVEAPEVDALAGCVDLGLVHRLRLTKHRRGVDGVAPRTRQQRSRAQHDRRALVIRGGRPHATRLQSRVDRVVEVLDHTDRVPPNAQLLAVRRAQVALAVARAVLAADRHRDLCPRIGELGKPALEALTMRIAWRILAHRFVDRTRDLEMSVGGHASRVTKARIDRKNPPSREAFAVLEYSPGQLTETAAPERVARTVALLRRRGYALSPARLAAMCAGGALQEHEVRRVAAASPNLTIVHDLVVERDHMPRLDEIRGRANGHDAASPGYLAMTRQFVRALVAAAPFVRSVWIAGSLASGGFRDSDDVDLNLVVDDGHRHLAYVAVNALGLVHAIRHRGKPVDDLTRRPIAPRLMTANLILERSQLSPLARQDEGMAFELMVSQPVFGFEVFEQIVALNPELTQHFPQLAEKTAPFLIDAPRARLPRWTYPAMLDGAARIFGSAAWRYMQWTRRHRPEALARVAFVRETMRPYTLFDS